jgi:penicillin-binding protein 1A
VKDLVDSGKLGDDRVLNVRTTLDVNLQQHAEASIEDALRESGPRWHASQAATVMLEPNGAVRAIVGGRDYGESQFNRAIDAERQPGSSFKPFVYLTALKTGRFNEHSTVDASSLCIGNWCPQNYHGESAGRIPIVEALAKSINTAAVWLSIKIGEAYWPRGEPYHLARIAQLGRAKIVETAKAMGLTTPLPDTVSLPIGADDVKPIDMASAFSVFAAGGKRSPAYAVVEVHNSKGDVIYNHDRDAPPPVQIEPADKIAEMVYMMTQVVQVGTGRAAQLDGITVAGKTGTTNNSRDAWFIGYTGNYVAAVWFGNDDFSPMNGMVGGSLPAATWHEIMAYAHQGIELKPLPGLPIPQGPANVASNEASGLGAPHRPATLSHKSAAALGDIEQLFRSADQGRRLGLGPVASPVTLAAGGSVRALATMQ